MPKATNLSAVCLNVIRREQLELMSIKLCKGIPHKKGCIPKMIFKAKIYFLQATPIHI